jgi:subtilisin family serine protease
MFARAILVVVALLHVATALVPLTGTDYEEVIPGQYIVVFKKESTAQQRDAHMKTLFQGISGDMSQQIIARYDIGDFHGYAARLSDDMVAAQRTKENLIDYIAADQVVHAAKATACSQQTNADWGLDRTDQRTPILDGFYRYDSTGGSGVDAYIIDTGIRVTHVDFGGRAVWGINYADTTNDDCNGHGTHVAGTVGGNTWGIAKNTKLIAVKVLGCSGSGSWAGVISGVQWVANQYQASKRPSVANMSLGGGLYTALNDAVTAAINVGVTFVLAAGNNNGDACLTSPASTPTAITVGATTIDEAAGAEMDERAYFSNYGTCVHVLAPGNLITSAYIGSDTATRVLSGTSMASPHVCGVAAMYLGLNPTATPAAVKSFITSTADQGRIDMICTNQACNNTPNLLLHNVCS